MRRLIFLIFFLPICSYAQNFSVNLLSDNLKNGAYAVVRQYDETVEFQKIDKYKYKVEKAITVFNESGMRFAIEPIYYNKSLKINKFQSILYDAQGKEIRKLRSKDLKDISIYDGFSLFNDTRIQYYDITPPTYPFTVYYHYEVESSNTSFMPGWMPIEGYNLGVESANYTFINSTNIETRKMESSFDYPNIEKSESGRTIKYAIKNIPSLEQEPLSPGFLFLVPHVRIMASEFQIEGIKGQFSNWEEFGKWYYNSLVKGRQEVSPKDKEAALQLTSGISDPKEKIRVLYEFMQSKTRYVNVSIGIGGWEPFPASYVSDKSYGDCKALSNYMVSLLKLVGIDGYHTVVYGNHSQKLDFKTDFTAFEGNHMIVNVPLEDETIWLECTSQQLPYNFLGYFTDDRKALSVTPSGGEIVDTQYFSTESNRETIHIKGELLPNGNMNADFSFESKGLEYNREYEIFFKATKEQKEEIHEKFSSIPNFSLLDYEMDNNRTDAVFTLNVAMESGQYAKNIGNNMLFNLIPYSRTGLSLKKDENRKYPFEIRYGYISEVSVELKIPEGYKLSEAFRPIIYADEFGDYILLVENKEPGKLKIYRKITTKDGSYPKEKFNDYVEFQRKISSMDNSKILLDKN
ncbi:MAG: DUF3857 domain-containing protein [Weeksellaceae bacterium]